MILCKMFHVDLSKYGAVAPHYDRYPTFNVEGTEHGSASWINKYLSSNTITEKLSTVNAVQKESWLLTVCVVILSPRMLSFCCVSQAEGGILSPRMLSVCCLSQAEGGIRCGEEENQFALLCKWC